MFKKLTTKVAIVAVSLLALTGTASADLDREADLAAEIIRLTAVQLACATTDGPECLSVDAALATQTANLVVEQFITLAETANLDPSVLAELASLASASSVDSVNATLEAGAYSLADVMLILAKSEPEVLGNIATAVSTQSSAENLKSFVESVATSEGSAGKISAVIAAVITSDASKAEEVVKNATTANENLASVVIQSAIFTVTKIAEDNGGTVDTTVITGLADVAIKAAPTQAAAIIQTAVDNSADTAEALRLVAVANLDIISEEDQAAIVTTTDTNNNNTATIVGGDTPSGTPVDNG